jgi:hypothetical protein
MAIMKPPPSSRRRVMLNLPVALPLFEMQNSTSSDDKTLRCFVDKTLNARVSMPVLTITTDSLRTVGDKKFQELEVNFYASSSIETTNSIVDGYETTSVLKKTFFVVMPSGWTPRTYAAAISMSLKNISFISVETVQINGCSYLSINDIDSYFSKRIHKKLVDSSAYLDVLGGERYGKLYS